MHGSSQCRFATPKGPKSATLPVRCETGRLCKATDALKYCRWYEDGAGTSLRYNAPFIMCYVRFCLAGPLTSAFLASGTSAVDHAFILVMRTNPEPRQDVALSNGQGSIGVIDAGRPEFTHGLQLQGRVTGVLPEDGVLSGSALPDVLRQRVVAMPKLGERPGTEDQV